MTLANPNYKCITYPLSLPFHLLPLHSYAVADLHIGENHEDNRIILKPNMHRNTKMYVK